MRRHGALQNLDVAILHMPPVAAQVNGDPLRASQLADDRGRNRIRLIALPSFTDRGNVIDVDSETHARRLADGRRASSDALIARQCSTASTTSRNRMGRTTS